jgi:hypothetical protein
LVLTYIIKYEKQAEFKVLVKQFLKIKKDNPEAFKGLKSWRLFQQEYGGIAGSYVEMWEYKSQEEMEKVNAEMMRYKEMMQIYTQFHKILDHATFTESIWNTVA